MSPKFKKIYVTNKLSSFSGVDAAVLSSSGVSAHVIFRKNYTARNLDFTALLALNEP